MVNNSVSHKLIARLIIDINWSISNERAFIGRSNIVIKSLNSKLESPKFTFEEKYTFKCIINDKLTRIRYTMDILNWLETNLEILIYKIKTYRMVGLPITDAFANECICIFNQSYATMREVLDMKYNEGVYD